MNKGMTLMKKVNWTLWLPVLFFFFYLLYTNQSVTLMGDDFRYSMRSCFNFVLPDERITTFYQMIETAFYDYFNLCARYATAVLIYFVLMFGTTLYKILNPIMISLQIILAAKFLSPNKKLGTKQATKIAILLILLFSMISPIVMDEDVYWITGAITYCWPVTFLLLHLNLFLFPDQRNKKLWLLPCYVLLSIYLGSTSENISITTTLITTVIIAYYCWFNKKKDYFALNRKVSYIVLVLANIIQILAPGTRHRTSTFDGSLLSNLFTGTFSFAQYQFFLASFIPVILIGLILMMLYQRNKRLFCLNLVFMLPMMFFIVLYNLPANDWIYQWETICRFIMPLDFYTWSNGMTPQLYLVFFYYWGVILLLITDIITLCVKENNFVLFILFLSSACSLLALIPIGGAVTRVSYVAIFFMMLTVSYIMTYYIRSKSIVMAIICMSFYYYCFHLDYLVENIQVAKEREMIYASLQENGEETIVLPKYRFSTHGNFADELTWEHNMFKLYYGITDKKLNFE